MDLHSFNMFADIAFECLDNERSKRPNIDDIVPRLEKALELQLKPQNYVRPFFSLHNMYRIYSVLDNERSKRPNIDDIVPRLEKALELQLKPQNYLMLQDNNSIVEGTSSSSIEKKFQHLKIKLEAIKSATNKFDEAHCIGKGGFGKVYKGELVHSKGRSIVAIKRLDRAFGQGNPEFWKEIIMLSLYQHDNIVSLLGFCDEYGEMILVYEYASKRSLDLYLKDLTWVQRLEICIGAARGLAYLHNPGQSQQRVLHRDIKSSNILLDENWNARIADFGLSKFGPANQPYTFLVSNGVGTIGYCDPLYVESGLLTKESDVYSFGVVLFEMLCGRLCIRNNQDKHQPLTELVRKCYKQNTIDKIIYHNIKDEINPHSLKAFTTIAYQCLEREREQRPLTTKVVNVLESALKAQVSNEPLASSSCPAESDLLDRRMLIADDTPKVGVPVALSEGPWIHFPFRVDMYRDEHGWKTMLRKIKIPLPDISVILKDVCSTRDMLKSMFHVSYLCWLEKNVGLNSIGISADCGPGGMLQISLDYVEREFNHAKRDGELAGWVTDSLIARPKPHRIRPDY
ncbi:Protein kinase, ATP binding site-containing protein [Artemisia annua]|uniref:Protein kinase, ATP binding site-containing protein n=1 Tax=Artemisia annua TaxID=35608 RepID=A0A2U1PLI4_ARTAN|nr:Protein kinase, ATP binding site-containing protein [Artemisia annua]